MTELATIQEPQGYGRYYKKSNKRCYASVTGERKGTKIRKVMYYIKNNGPVSKYEIVTKVLGEIGTKKSLRGYWCTNLASMRDCELLNYDYSTKEYSLTTISAKLVYTKDEAPALFL